MPTFHNLLLIPPTRPACLALLLMGAVVACQGAAVSETPAPLCGPASAPTSGPASAPAEAPAGTLALVNGVPITEAEVRLEAGKGSLHGAELDEARRTAVLENLIWRETLRQRALAQGLDRQPAYLERRRALEAQIRAFERTELPEALRRELASRATVPEPEVRAWFEQNRAVVTSEVHVLQILTRTRAAAEKASAALEAGRPFEEVARDLLPGLPAGTGAPWDLGFLRFGQLPAPWLPAVTNAAPGTNTAIVEGPGERFWILRIVARRPAVGVTYESVRQGIADRLAAERLNALVAETEKAARAGAKVVRLAPAIATSSED